MHIAIVKPSYGIRGGFETVVDHIAADLEATGHHVSWLHVDIPHLQPEVRGVHIPDPVYSQAAEYFRYLGTLEQFSRLDARSADLVLCTQPASWGVRHERKLALFYHHLRIFYDLADLYPRAGFAHPALHSRCTEEVRSIEDPILDEVSHFLVPSREVAGRLARFNGIDPAHQSPFHALGKQSRASVAAEPDTSGPVLCVSRHEWPKRTELAVSAAHQLAAPAPVVMVGSGGRLDHIHAMDRALAGADLDEIDDAQYWLPAATLPPPDDRQASGRVQIVGHVSDVELDALYRSVMCVVAPALLEDYGLTAIEAMSRGTPVITCTDSGGLLDSVRDGENGLVVQPTGRAIVEAIERLRDDPTLHKTLAAGALDTAAGYTWQRAADQLRAGLEAAMS